MSAEASAGGNVDAAEIDKFQSLASRWWDPDGEFRPLHEINPLRAEYIARQAGGLDGRTVLDIGCGGGLLAEALAAAGARVTGIDMAERSLGVARLHLHESKLDIDYRLGTAESLAAEGAGPFDVVTCLEVLEHVPDPASVVAAAAALLKPGGRLILSTINRNPKSFLLAIVAAEYVLGMVPRGTHSYRMLIKPSELAAAVRAAGLRLIDTTGLVYRPLTRRYALAADVDVNYLMCAIRDD